MRDFSLLYGPLRSWLPVAAIAALAMVIILNQSGGDEPDCSAGGVASVGECGDPLVGERQLLGNDRGLDVSPTGLVTDDGADTADTDAETPSPWDTFDPADNTVPFVSLEPSPEPMTEAGEDLARDNQGG